jgi:hypothetical protein
MILCPYWMSTTLSGGRRDRGISTRLYALYTVLAFVFVLVISGPHLVHHLPEILPSDNHPAHDEGPQPLPDCLVLAFMQHTPATAGGAACLPLLLHTRQQPPVKPSPDKPKVPRDLSQARAPPDTA